MSRGHKGKSPTFGPVIKKLLTDLEMAHELHFSLHAFLKIGTQIFQTQVNEKQHSIYNMNIHIWIFNVTAPYQAVVEST